MSATTIETSRRTRLRRFPGIETTSEHALAIPWAEFRHDPNRYYGLLELDRDRPVLMGEIRAAYRRRMREFHPDTGSYDQEMLDRLTVAHEVLSDPESRRRYDALGPGEVWMDRLLRRALEVRVLAEERERQVQEVLTELGL